MKVSKKVLAIALSVIISSQLFANSWRKLADRDLQFIYQTLQKNHPGTVDDQNKNFKNWLEKGFLESKKKVAKVSSYEGMVYLLQYYGSGFHDGHLFVGPKLKPNKVSWPGFVAQQLGGKFLVYADAEGAKSGPFRGWEIRSCDGHGIKKILSERIFPYFYGVSDIEADWVKLAPKTLVDYGNPWVEKIRKCSFIDKNGKTKELKLIWRKIELAKIRPILDAAAFGSTPKQGIRDDGEIVWISIPSFNPKKTDANGLKKIVRSISKFRNRKKIVFDVRGNTGGNSQWGEDILAGLYGENYIAFLDAELNEKEPTVEWRISKDNSAYLKRVSPWLKNRFGPDSSIYRVFSLVSREMAKSVADKKSGLLLQPKGVMERKVVASPQKADSPVKAKVFFLTDGKCASACLDFADKALKVPGVVHIGLPTSADTVYMDVRGVDLPSGVMRAGFAIKVYRGRSRGHNQFYSPKLRFKGDIGDSKALRDWVSTL